jgi:hypothetical protein
VTGIAFFFFIGLMHTQIRSVLFEQRIPFPGSYYTHGIGGEIRIMKNNPVYPIKKENKRFVCLFNRTSKKQCNQGYTYNISYIIAWSVLHTTI